MYQQGCCPKGSMFPSPQSSAPPSQIILSLAWRRESPVSNPSDCILTPLCGLKSCQESWHWGRHLAG